MSLSVLYRPQGVVLNETGVSAAISESYPATTAASVNSPGHGLATDSWVFIKSRVENYNGFFKVFRVNANQFILINNSNDMVQYIVEAEITYYAQASLHEWSAVFNPIVYRLSNNRWPTNTVYTIRTISSFNNVNGNVRITASGALNGTVTNGDYIKIFGFGVYRIIDAQSTSVVVIDLAYSASYTFTGSQVQIYNNNYNVLVRVYAGFNAGSMWESIRPMELAATLRLTPDSNNEVMFSVHEIVKSYINQRNGTLLATLPNNTDFWTNFKIAYAESFDNQDFAYTVDSFVGNALNAKLPFKNRYSGFMTEYLTKFLTVFDEPVMFAGSGDIDNNYFDLTFFDSGFINQVIKQEWYNNDVLQTTTGKLIKSAGGGIYRVQPDQNCAYDRLDVTIMSSFVELQSLDQWVNVNTGGPAWTPGASPSVTIPAVVSTTTDEITGNAVAYAAGAYNFSIQLFVTNNNASVRLIIHVKGYKSGTPIGDGSDTRTITLPTDLVGSNIPVTFSDIPDKIAVYIFLDAVSGGGNTDVELRSFSNFEVAVTETKTIKIQCECEEQNGPFTPFYLTWLNNLGGFEYWKFEAFNDNMIFIGETGETSQNTFPNWPYSYGEFADTEKRRQSFRETTKQYTVRSQEITSKDQINSLSTIKESPLVQIINSRYDKRTVIVDANSFLIYKDGDKTYNISFTITLTDDNPAQSI